MTQREHDRLLSDEQLDDKTNYEGPEIRPCVFCGELFNTTELVDGYCPSCQEPKCSQCGIPLDSEIGEETLSGLCSTCLGDGQ